MKTNYLETLAVQLAEFELKYKQAKKEYKKGYREGAKDLRNGVDMEGCRSWYDPKYSDFWKEGYVTGWHDELRKPL